MSCGLYGALVIQSPALHYCQFYTGDSTVTSNSISINFIHVPRQKRLISFTSPSQMLLFATLPSFFPPSPPFNGSIHLAQLFIAPATPLSIPSLLQQDRGCGHGSASGMRITEMSCRGSWSLCKIEGQQKKIFFFFFSQLTLYQTNSPTD